MYKRYMYFFTQNGLFPLMVAVEIKNEALVSLFLSRGAEVNISMVIFNFQRIILIIP